MALKRSTLLLILFVSFILVIGGAWIGYNMLRQYNEGRFNEIVLIIDQALQDQQYDETAKLIKRASRYSKALEVSLRLLKRSHELSQRSGNVEDYLTLSRKTYRRYSGSDAVQQIYADALLLNNLNEEVISLYEIHPNPNLISFVLQATKIDFAEKGTYRTYFSYYKSLGLSAELYLRRAELYQDPALIKNALLLLASENNFARALDVYAQNNLDDLRFLSLLQLSNGDVVNSFQSLTTEINRQNSFNPSQPENYDLLGNIYFVAQNYEEALASYKQAKEQYRLEDLPVNVLVNFLYLEKLLNPTDFVATVNAEFDKYGKITDLQLVFIDNYLSLIKEKIDKIRQETDFVPSGINETSYLYFSGEKLTDGTIWPLLNDEAYNLDLLMFLTEYFLETGRTIDARIMLSRIANIKENDIENEYESTNSWLQLTSAISEALALRKSYILERSKRTSYLELYESLNSISMREPLIFSYNKALLYSIQNEPALLRSQLEDSLDRIDTKTLFQARLLTTQEKHALAKIYLLLGSSALREGQEIDAQRYLNLSTEMNPDNPLAQFYRAYLPQLNGFRE